MCYTPEVLVTRDGRDRSIHPVPNPICVGNVCWGTLLWVNGTTMHDRHATTPPTNLPLPRRPRSALSKVLQVHVTRRDWRCAGPAANIGSAVGGGARPPPRRALQRALQPGLGGAEGTGCAVHRRSQGEHCPPHSPQSPGPTPPPDSIVATQRPVKGHSKATQRPVKCRSTATQRPFQIHSNTTQRLLKDYPKAAQRPLKSQSEASQRPLKDLSKAHQRLTKGQRLGRAPIGADLETVQDMFITPLYQQHASHTLASRAYGPQPHMRSSSAAGPYIIG